MHEEREGEEEEKEGVVRQGEGGRGAQREGQNSEKGGGGIKREGLFCLSCLVPPESPLLYGEALLHTE